MSFLSVLGNIGKGLAKVFVVGEKAAVIAEPFVDVVFPGVAPLFNTVLGEVGKAEAAAVAAGAQNGTGAQKLALVTASVEGSVNAYLTARGIKTPATAAQVEAVVNGLVAALNALPAA